MIETDVIVIGAGPAGLFSAINIRNKKIVILEKNLKPGRKLLLAGSGRCNITNTGDLSDFSRHYGNNFKYIKPALMSFSNMNLINFLNSNGIPTIVDKNLKVFPSSQKSIDILNLLIRKCSAKNIEIVFNSPVIAIKRDDDNFIITTNSNIYKSKFLVLATGGMTYPRTGSNGDGYQIAETLGQEIIPPKLALTPIIVKDYKFQLIAGVSLEKCPIYLYRNNKKLLEHIGDIGFTHIGLSGPGILDFSRYFEIGDVVKLNIANSNFDDMSPLFKLSLQNEPKKSIRNFFKKFSIPDSLVIRILEILNIDSSIQLANLKKEDRNKLIDAFCSYPFEIQELGGLNTAMVTAGGVSFKDINIKTLESRIVENLYFAGEILDIDGDTGGYNLQAAFSSGYLVAKSISEKK